MAKNLREESRSGGNLPSRIDPLKRRAFFGRRKGRRLSSSQQDLLQNFLPEIRIDPNILAIANQKNDPRSWFDQTIENVWLEIGFGSGEHLAEQAASHPKIGIIGAEVFQNGIAALLAYVKKNNLRNVRIHPEEARLLLSSLQDRSISRVFFLFPDPWPKNRHKDRRFLQHSILDEIARIAEKGAEIRFASDDPVMIEWGLRLLTSHPAFYFKAQSPEDWRQRGVDWPPTRYEAKAIRAGRKPFYFTFRRI